jgi:hypothetical protein
MRFSHVGNPFTFLGYVGIVSEKRSVTSHRPPSRLHRLGRSFGGDGVKTLSGVTFRNIRFIGYHETSFAETRWGSGHCASTHNDAHSSSLVVSLWYSVRAEMTWPGPTECVVQVRLVGLLISMCRLSLSMVRSASWRKHALCDPHADSVNIYLSSFPRAR